MMKSLREFIYELEREGTLKKVKRPVSLKYELASVLHHAGETPLLFENVKESEIPAVGNIFANKSLVAKYLNLHKEELTKALVTAISRPSAPMDVPPAEAPVMQNIIENPDLTKFPIPIHTEKDGGPYIASAIIVANDPEYGRNSSFHRMMLIDKDKFAVRILPRHLNEYIERAGGELRVAVVIGSPINVLLASAISVDIKDDEFGIANTLMPFNTVQLPMSKISVPADAEFVLDATITKEMHDEGPFVDLTETFDIVRQQRVMKVHRIYHRNNPLFHTLLPGGFEHKILMGMPREPTIFMEVNKVVECKGVNVTPGGCSWLHGVVAIRKKSEEDGKKAIEAAFNGHKSMKHVVIVDDDIDISNPLEVEWAIATRFQASKDLIVRLNEKGSSLDPSADPITYATSKVGIDATKPLSVHGKNFEKVKYIPLNISDYI
ncbi:MAG: UbiD family decarboxylase [Candidatus Micrarchaeota archaeon]|nr:UbiD family decarboxylase [Candidatus Micrarchaeota archaeon]